MSEGRVTFFGEGQPLLLVNGIFQSKESWAEMAADLGRFFKVITFDFPNQSEGHSDPGCNRIDAYADVLLSVLSECDVEPSSCVAHGFSFSANLLRHLHLRRKVPFKALVLAGISSPDLSPFQVERFVAWKYLARLDLDFFARQLFLQLLSQQFIARSPVVFRAAVTTFKKAYGERPQALLALTEALIDYHANVRDEPRDFQCDLHLIVSEGDQLTPAATVREYAKQIGKCTLTAFSGGHLSRIEDRARLTDLLYKVTSAHDATE